MPGILLYQSAKKGETVCTINWKIKHQLQGEEQLDVENVHDLVEQSIKFTKEERKLRNIWSQIL